MNLINFESDAAWEGRFNEYLRSNSRALDSLRALVDAGVSESWLLQMLYDYGDEGLWKRERFRQRTNALASLKEINGALTALNKASEALERLSGNDSVPDWVRDHYFNLRRDLATQLKAYRGAMGEVKNEVTKLASAKGGGITEQLLAGLVEAVIHVTGQPHWGDLAYLIEASYFAHHRKGEADRDKIRKRYDRFVKNFPRVHETWLDKDWKCFFGLDPQIAGPMSANPQEAMDQFIKRFSPKTRRQLSTKPRYGKIHRSMKR